MIENKLSELGGVPTVDKVGVEERVARFQSRSIKKHSKMQKTKQLVLAVLNRPASPGASKIASGTPMLSKRFAKYSLLGLDKIWHVLICSSTPRSHACNFHFRGHLRAKRALRAWARRARLP